jgi:hypothetical protein
MNSDNTIMKRKNSGKDINLRKTQSELEHNLRLSKCDSFLDKQLDILKKRKNIVESDMQKLKERKQKSKNSTPREGISLNKNIEISNNKTLDEDLNNICQYTVEVIFIYLVQC